MAKIPPLLLALQQDGGEGEGVLMAVGTRELGGGGGGEAIVLPGTSKWHFIFSPPSFPLPPPTVPWMEKEPIVVMRLAGFFRVRARIGLEKVGFGLQSGSGLHYKFFIEYRSHCKKFYNIPMNAICKI